MAIYHLHASVVHRNLGYSAVAASAYAAGKDVYNERAEKMEAYGRKGGVYHTQIIAPDHAPEWVYDRQQLWNRAEQAEKRIDAQTARVFVLALPYELTAQQKITLVNDYVRDAFVSEGMVVDIGIHCADRNGDQRNDHVHLVLTMRELDGEAFSSTKNREWNRKETLVHWRAQWAEYQNRALEAAGSDARVDHRTLEEQGIDREPTTHLGREATLMERRGGKAELGDINREIAGQNQRIDELVNELAEIDAQIAEEMTAEFLPKEPDTPESEPSAEDGAFYVGAISSNLKLPASVLAEIDKIREVLSGVTSQQEKPDTPQQLFAVKDEDHTPVDLFSSPIVLAFESDIKERGEITERGIGGSWIARTVTLFENIYYGTKDYVRSAFERIVRRHEYPEQPDKDVEDYEPDR